MPNYAERITEEANALAGAVRLANATTGAEDTGIVDAVATLIAGYGIGDSPDFSVKGAYTKNIAGYGIDSGIHIADVPSWTLFMSFNTTSIASNNCFLHGMYESGAYPGFTFDCYRSTKARVSINSYQVYDVFDTDANVGRKKIVFRCENDRITVFTEKYPSGRLFDKSHGLSGLDSVTLCVGQIKLANGTYSRNTEMSDIDIDFYKYAADTSDCSAYVI